MKKKIGVPVDLTHPQPTLSASCPDGEPCDQILVLPRLGNLWSCGKQTCHMIFSPRYFEDVIAALEIVLKFVNVMTLLSVKL